MVQSVRIPLSWANEIIGVSGVDDVTFDVPTLQDITDAVVNNTLDRTTLDEALADALGDAAVEISGLDLDVEGAITDALADVEDQVQLALRQVLADLDLPTPDQLAEDLVRELTNLGGFFGPLEQDFQRALQETLGDPELVIEGLELPTEQIVSGVEDALSDLSDLEVPSVEEIADAVQQALRDVLADLPGGSILLAPDEFVDAQIDRVTDGLVSEDARQNLESELEGVL